MPCKNPTKFNQQLLTRLFSKVKKSTEYSYNGSVCWEWTASRNRLGYGQFGYKRETVASGMCQPHIVMYELFVKPIPEGLECDHLCRHPFCVNPAHIEAVTHAENMKRTPIVIARRAKTHCPQGHPYDVENTYHPPNKPTIRQCLICSRGRARVRSNRAYAKIIALPYNHPDRTEWRNKQNARKRARRQRQQLAK